MAKAKTKKQDDTLVEFREAMTSTCTHKGPIFHALLGLDRCVLTMGGDIRSPLPNWSPPLVSFHQLWIYMVGKKHSREADQLTLASGSSEHA